MKRAITLSLAALFVLGMMSIAMAGEEKAGKDLHKIQGEIVKVDPDAKTLIVKQTPKDGGEPKEVTFGFDEKTLVMQNDKAATMTDLQAGLTITVVYRNVDGRDMAQQIVVARPKG